MLKFLATLVHDISAVVRGPHSITADCATACLDWLRDPLAHPDLDAMSQLEIADLPAGELRARARV